MKTIISILVLLAAVLIAAGCGNESTESKTSATARMEAATPPAGEGQAGAASGDRAEAAVVPGSYEDWCDEHAVPESACTRCDSSLIPAFKAVNDWDEEHGVPMSQCLKHNPNLKITRPPAPEAPPKPEGK